MTTNLARHATLTRTLKLLVSFPQEQKNPARFYRGLAADTCAQAAAALADAAGTTLAGLKVLDVGGGPGFFAQAFQEAGATYFSCEPDVAELAAAGLAHPRAVRASGTALPYPDKCFDLVLSSNVAEHVAQPWLLGSEMLRVVKPGGLVLFSYTIWLGPFGGHETGLWQHYLGGHFARRRYEKQHGRPPKNVFGTSLFDVSAADGLTFARTCGARVIAAIPRYHPRFAWWVVKVPLLREFLTSNLLLVLQKPAAELA